MFLLKAQKEGMMAIAKRANYVKLPSLDIFARLFVGNDDDEFGYFATCHPFVELGHDLFDVGFDLIIDCDCLEVSPGHFPNNITRKE